MVISLINKVQQGMVTKNYLFRITAWFYLSQSNCSVAIRMLESKFTVCIPSKGR